MHIFEYDKLWGPSQRVVTLFIIAICILVLLFVVFVVNVLIVTKIVC